MTKKFCGCGRSFLRREWAALPAVGHQRFPDEFPLELRNCPCGTTLAVNVLPMTESGRRFRLVTPPDEFADDEVRPIVRAVWRSERATFRATARTRSR